MYNFSCFALLFCVLTFASCENDLEQIRQVTEKDTLPVETAENIEVLYSEHGKIQVKLTAPVLENFTTADPYVRFPSGLKVTFFKDQMLPDSWLRADFAIRYPKRQMMEARNNVVVVNRKGERLNTEHLIWDERKALIKSDEFVKVTNQEEIIYGKGFEANQDFTHYRIFNISGTIRVKNTP